MSLQNRNPIRVSELPLPVYVPRVPSHSVAKAYGELNDAATQATTETRKPELDPSSSPTAGANDTCPMRVALPRLDQDVRKEELSSFEQLLACPADVRPPATTKVWGIPFHVVTMEQTLDYLEHVMRCGKPSYAVTANLNYAMLCSKDPRLAAFTEKSVLTLCDGMPILWRSRLDKLKLPERVAGADLIYRLTERCAQQKLRVYFYGASEGIAEKAAAALKKRYPNLIIAGVQCPPFGTNSPVEVRGQLDRIKNSKPDLLYVALGQPKGEYWIEEHLEELGVPLTIQLGASFDFVAGNSTRAPMIWQKLGLEWLHRTIKDPKRLAPRYFNNLLYLLKTVHRELIEKLS